MSDNNKISVIVPIFNLENEIARCVNSICQQTCTNLEIILVDDGSTDHSAEVIDSLTKQDERIVPIYKENGGVTSARIAGIRRATGTYIGFVDGDDEIEADMYERLLNNALKYSADISHCGYQMVFPDGRVNKFHGTNNLLEQDTFTALKELLDGSTIEPGLWNKLFHKKLLQSVLMGDVMANDIRINEDLLMNYYLFKDSAKSVFEDWCPYHYIVRHESATRQALNYHKIFDPIRVKQIIWEDSEEEIKEVAETALVRTIINVYGTLTTDKKYSKEKRIIRKELLLHGSAVDNLSQRTMLLGKMILYVPYLFDILYPFYVKRFQRNRYE